MLPICNECKAIAHAPRPCRFCTACGKGENTGHMFNCRHRCQDCGGVDECCHRLPGTPAPEGVYMTRAEQRDGICGAHCCTKHGCKYGRADCAVAAGRVTQEHPCPYCAPKKTIAKVVELLFPISLMDREALTAWVTEHFDDLRAASDFDPW